MTDEPANLSVRLQRSAFCSWCRAALRHLRPIFGVLRVGTISLSRFGYRVPMVRNFGVYLAGLALTTSPGKLGKTLRTLLLMPYGVKARHSLGAFVADRLADVLGMCLLGIVAVMAGGKIAWFLIAVFLGLLIVSLFAGYAVVHPGSGRFWSWLVLKLHWLPVRGGQAIVASWASLWSPGRAISFALVAVAAYGTQACVYGWFCLLAGVDIPLADAVVIFVNATLFGAASMVPGGLGTMESALVFQLVAQGAADPVALSVAIATRLVTLWMGVLLGVISLMAVSGSLTREGFSLLSDSVATPEDA
jgi:uncharacterized membrane protein YbhN (UPF0104 family)